MRVKGVSDSFRGCAVRPPASPPMSWKNEAGLRARLRDSDNTAW